MRRPTPVARFAVTAMLGMVLMTVLWSQVAAWTTQPVAVVAGWVLERAAPQWVRRVQTTPGVITVDTSVAIATAQTGGRLAEIMLEAKPGHYAYGLPIFLALLLAARAPGRGWRALAGYALLVPAQVFSLVMYLLMQLVTAAQLDLRVLKITQAQLEFIIYGYQVGALVLPTLAPIMAWLWLDRRYVGEVLVQAWRQPPAAGVAEDAGAMPVAGAHPPAQLPPAAAALEAQEAGSSPPPAMPPAPAAPAGPQISDSSSITLPTRTRRF